MTDLPKISRMKFGIIDSDYMNSITNAVNDYNGKKDSIEKMLAKVQKKKPEKILVKITDATIWQTYSFTRFNGLTTATATIAWRYKISTVILPTAIEPVAVDTDLVVQTNDFVLSHNNTHAGYGYNLSEMSNGFTVPVVFGVDMTGEDYPVGFEPQPLAVGSIVFADRYVCEDGAVIFLFDRQGVHDGTCE